MVGAPEKLLPLADMERRHLLAILKVCGGNQSKAARILGISKITLWRKLKEYGVDPKSFATSKSLVHVVKRKSTRESSGHYEPV